MQAPAWIAALPKVELHVHIEGTLEPELMFELADRHGAELPYADVAAVRAAYEFEDLSAFLSLYYRGADVLRTTRDFFELTWTYLRRARTDGVRHVELFFDPQTHTDRGVPFEAVVEGIDAALQRGRSELGLSAEAIACFLRHLDADAAMATLDSILRSSTSILGVGLDSAERGHPPSKFTEVFARARAAGLRTVAHAGEEGPPAYISEALELLEVERIDHGVRCLEDEPLVERLIRDAIPLTVCPLSNVRLRVFDRLEDHNLPELLRRGLRATINSDDPAYFGGYIGENYRACVEALGLSAAQVERLARNAVDAAFVDAARRAELSAAVDAWAEAWLEAPAQGAQGG